MPTPCLPHSPSLQHNGFGRNIFGVHVYPFILWFCISYLKVSVLLTTSCAASNGAPLGVQDVDMVMIVGFNSMSYEGLTNRNEDSLMWFIVVQLVELYIYVYIIDVFLLIWMIQFSWLEWWDLSARSTQHKRTSWQCTLFGACLQTKSPISTRYEGWWEGFKLMCKWRPAIWNIRFDVSCVNLWHFNGRIVQVLYYQSSDV